MNTRPQIFKGRFAEAHVFATDLDDEVVKQIEGFLDCPALEGARIRIMPDCHAGAGAVIGFTAPVGDKVIPNVIGVDIGCGVVMATDDGALTDIVTHDGFPAIDQAIRARVPFGFGHRDEPYGNMQSLFDIVGTRHQISFASFMASLELVGGKIGQSLNTIIRQIGTLGSGNHFIEVDVDEQGRHVLTVHSGSRNFGLRVAEYHQRRAQEFAGGDRRNALAWLEGADAREYLADMRAAQMFAELNQLAILDAILTAFSRGVGQCQMTESVHNFIGSDGIIRKGAVSARAGEPVIIPWNMRDGLVVGVGLGNPDWNNSAPHGSGRRMSRNQALRTLSVDAFTQEMNDAGIWSSCVGQSTLDESPAAYKPTRQIMDVIGETVRITATYKPVYNFKA
ncbi:MAG TPA: RtcB family protein [Myxococcota bacterium]|nr:RtcB family protein [Myxococcota bacterium]